ncbi:MAG: patatin-like phospholipase family protein [Ancalomicrobiaceae bacterium]|nr:patatin-like phospholipase family protein [Ancalomicrobiaceae bacterium]
MAGLPAACASLDNAPINLPSAIPQLAAAEPITGDDSLRTTIVGLAFSGGGTRAAAFSFGVLKGLDQVRLPEGGRLLDQVRFVSGVSGGSVTAAYFGLKGRAALADFESRFLYRNAEESLRTQIYSVDNMARALGSGVNDRSGLPTWLEKNVFGKATFADMNRPGRPRVWINASDINAKTAFIFEPVTFAAICSDLNAYPVAEAVAASAAVPIVFAPVVIKSYADKCGFEIPRRLQQVVDDRNASANVRAYGAALRRYRNVNDISFVKLLDGGLTDNWGLDGVNVALASADEPYQPLSRQDAIALQKFLFIVVDSGRTLPSDWSRTLEGPNGTELLEAVTATAIDSSVRNSFEVSRLEMQRWEERLKAWRCSLSSQEVADVRGSTDGWDCHNVEVRIDRVSFEDLDPATKGKLEQIPTRFVLDPKQVRLAIDSGAAATVKVMAPIVK